MKKLENNNLQVVYEKQHRGGINIDTYSTSGNYEIQVANLNGVYNVKAYPKDQSARLFAPTIVFTSKENGALEYPSTPVPFELSQQSLDLIIHATALFSYLHQYYDELIERTNKDVSDVERE